ncbi:aldo/keto reductase [Micromonospora chalcea]
MYDGTGLGTFPFASPFTPMDAGTAYEVLDAYFGAGGIYVDTAPTYAFGRVEELLGTYLASKPREAFAISTSCGYVRDGDSFRISGKPDDVRRDAYESLERLKLDYLDVYISHIPDVDTPYEQTAEALQALKEEGIARVIGVSNVSANQLRRYASAAEIGIVQNRISYLNRSLDAGLISALESSGARLVGYQVLERGLLTTAGNRSLRDGDLRNRKPEFQAERRSWVRRLVGGPLMDVARRNGVTVEQLVVRWVLAQNNVALAQMGATNATQAESIPTYRGQLSPGLYAEIEEIYRAAEEQLMAEGHRSVQAFLGLDTYDVRSGSASGS